MKAYGIVQPVNGKFGINWHQIDSIGGQYEVIFIRNCCTIIE
jgi:hypothetical protein